LAGDAGALTAGGSGSVSESGATLTVDIVVNNHNYASFLGAAIESACAQTHRPLNVIVVDDGSSDDSRNVIASYGERVTAVFKDRGGQASALNAAIGLCRGEVVIFLDADDRLHPAAAEQAAAAFAADEEVVKVQSRMDVIDADGRPTGAIKPANHLSMPQGDMRRAELAFPFDITWMAMSANAFRRRALERIFPIPEEDYPVSGADWYLVHLTALLGPVVSLEEVLASYRVHGRNNYEPQAAELSVAHLRKAIERTRATAKALLSLAIELEAPHPERILSLADLANRLISVRLEPELHPIPGDRPAGLALDAVRAAQRRTNASAAMKALFAAWFATVAVAPRPLVAKLAVLFLFPERRTGLNDLLRRMQRRNRDGAIAAASK
jgi:GT2 family glycosyltransferase